jgi:hypothetical protein
MYKANEVTAQFIKDWIKKETSGENRNKEDEVSSRIFMELIASDAIRGFTRFANIDKKLCVETGVNHSLSMIVFGISLGLQIAEAKAEEVISNATVN